MVSSNLILEWYPPNFGRRTAPAFKDGSLGNGDPGSSAMLDVDLRSIADGDVSGIVKLADNEDRLMGRAGTMCTMRAAWSRCLCLRRAILVAVVGWTSARAKTLVDLRAVGMKLPPSFPAFKVQAVSHTPEEMEPSSTPCLG